MRVSCTANAGNVDSCTISFHNFSDSHWEGLGFVVLWVADGPERKNPHSTSSNSPAPLMFVAQMRKDSNILSFSNRLRATLQYSRYVKKLLRTFIRVGRSFDFSDFIIPDLKRARYLLHRSSIHMLFTNFLIPNWPLVHHTQCKFMQNQFWSVRTSRFKACQS